MTLFMLFVIASLAVLLVLFIASAPRSNSSSGGSRTSYRRASYWRERDLTGGRRR